MGIALHTFGRGARRAGPQKATPATLTARFGCGTVWVMSAIELAPLSDRLDEEEVKALGRLLEQAGTKLPALEEHITHTFAKRLSEEAMTEFLDRLDAHDVAADIYLPIEFEGPLTVGDYRVASAHALQETLEEMKEELAIEDEDDFDDEEDEDEDDEEMDEGSVIEAQMRNIWQLVNDACGESIEKNFPLHLRV
jgi:hypothetical protein